MMNRSWESHRAPPHELFHYMMYVTHGYGWDDPEWEACNPPGFQYGNGGIYDRDPTSGILNHPQLGFVDHYATSAIAEDMAEMWMRVPLRTPRSRAAYRVAQDGPVSGTEVQAALGNPRALPMRGFLLLRYV